MASLYRCSVSWPVSRAKGKSVVSKAAYNAREKLYNEREGRWKDFTKETEHSRGKEDVLFSGIFVDPKFNAPDWIYDRGRLWNMASRAERTRKNALDGGQEMILNLPNDLDLKAHIRMTTDFVRETLTRGTGRIADVQIHDSPKTGDERNKHVHVLFTIRKIGPDGFEERLDPLTPDDIRHIREKWAQRGERELRRGGFEQEADRWRESYLTNAKRAEKAFERGDFEHYEDLRDREPTPHLGPHVKAMEEKGERTRKGDKHKEINERNERRSRAKAEDRAPADLTGNSREIWLAYNSSRTARQFVNELSERGLHIARVTEADIQHSRPDFGDPREELGHLMELRQNGVWMLQMGGYEALNAKQRDSAVRSHEAYLLKPDKQRKLGLYPYIEFVQELNDKRVEDLTERKKTLDFADGGLHVDASSPKHGGIWSKPGDYVVITESGTLYQLNKRTTGRDREDIKTFLKPLDRDTKVLSVTQTRKAIEDRWNDIRGQRADASGRGREKLRMAQGMGGAVRVATGFVRAADKAVTFGTDILESFFAAPMTPEKLHDGAVAKNQREFLADEAIRKRHRDSDRDR